LSKIIKFPPRVQEELTMLAAIQTLIGQVEELMALQEKSRGNQVLYQLGVARRHLEWIKHRLLKPADK
jgi:hypothetical protein